MYTHPSAAVTTSFYSTIMAARLALTLTIVRVTPWNAQRRVMIAIAIAIFIQWVISVVQMYWVCEKGKTGWKFALFATCPSMNNYVYISQILSEY